MSEHLSGLLPGETVKIVVDSVTEPFWEAAKQEKLTCAQCGECGHFRMPTTPFCPECQSTKVDWPELSGEGVIYSFAVVHGYPGLPDAVLVPAVVDLPDAPGARLVTNVVGVDPASVEIGQRVAVEFSPIGDGWKLPVFRRAGSRSED